MPLLLERAARRAARSPVLRDGAVAIVASVAVLVLAARPGLAHAETFFQLGAERVQPGGQVEIRADLGSGDAFAVVLISETDGTRRDLGTLPASEEGHLETYLTIPADVAAGDYLVEISYDGIVLRAPLAVAGAPIVDEDGEQPGQEEPIIVPPLSGASTVGSGAAPAPAALAPSPPPARWVDGPVLGLAAAAAAVLVVVLRIARRRPPL